MLLVSALLQAFVATASVPTAVAARCDVVGETGNASDVSRATAACETSRERFRDLFGEPVPDVTVVLWGDSGYRTGIQGRRAVIYWPTGDALEARSPADPRHAADPWREVLPHEIAHVLLAARFFAGGTRAATPPGAYGTPFPDWLDEAAAIWAEPPSARRERLRDARRLPAARRDLRWILTTRHPGASDPAVMAMRDGAPPPDSEDLVAFYPLALSVLGFVYDAGGPAAVLELAERLAADTKAALQAMEGLPGLPGDLASVERAWRRWIDEASATSAAAR